MQIKVTTDHNLEATDHLVAQIEEAVEAVLSRFTGRLTRVDVHLVDENAGKGGADDKRCTVEARPARRKPVAATNRGPTVEAACRGALHKLETLLERRFERQDGRNRRVTIRQPDEP